MYQTYLPMMIMNYSQVYLLQKNLIFMERKDMTGLKCIIQEEDLLMDSNLIYLLRKLSD